MSLVSEVKRIFRTNIETIITGSLRGLTQRNGKVCHINLLSGGSEQEQRVGGNLALVHAPALTPVQVFSIFGRKQPSSYYSIQSESELLLEEDEEEEDEDEDELDDDFLSSSSEFAFFLSSSSEFDFFPSASASGTFPSSPSESESEELDDDELLLLLEDELEELDELEESSLPVEPLFLRFILPFFFPFDFVFLAAVRFSDLFNCWLRDVLCTYFFSFLHS